MTQLISNVLMQPKMPLERTTQPMTDAVVERPQRKFSLIEKLEQVIVEHNAEFDQFIDEATDHQKIAHTAVLAGLLSAIKVAKNHSDWVSVDERLPGDRGYFLVRLNTGEITVDYYDYDNSYWSKNYGNVTHFMRLPQPPSEAQDAT